MSSEENIDQLIGDFDNNEDNYDSDLELDGVLSDDTLYEDNLEEFEYSCASDSDNEVLTHSSVNNSFSKSGIEWNFGQRNTHKTNFHNFVTDNSGLKADAKNITSILSSFMLFLSN